MHVRDLFDLREKVAVVTGGSRGIGKTIAEALGEAGARLVITGRREQWLIPAAEELAAYGFECRAVLADVTRPGDVERTVQTALDAYGHIDILVNNAGITRDRSLRKLTDEEWLTVIDNNLHSVYLCTTAAMPVMIEQKYGRIINISSYVGQAGNFGQANYAASKGGIIAFTKTAAIELAKFNITVNAIAPGFTLTDMLAKVAPEIQEQIKARIPMGRFGKPDEVAKVVVFIAADGDYITGQQINVNGGIYM